MEAAQEVLFSLRCTPHMPEGKRMDSDPLRQAHIIESDLVLRVQRAGRKRGDTPPDASLAPSAASAIQTFESIARETLLPGPTKTSHSTSLGAPGHEQQLHTRILELEHRLREIEAARASGLDKIRLVLGKGDNRKEVVLPLETPQMPAPTTDAAMQGSGAWAQLGQLCSWTKSAFRKWIDNAHLPGTGVVASSNKIPRQESGRA